MTITGTTRQQLDRLKNCPPHWRFWPQGLCELTRVGSAKAKRGAGIDVDTLKRALTAEIEMAQQQRREANWRDEVRSFSELFRRPA